MHQTIGGFGRHGHGSDWLLETVEDYLLETVEDNQQASAMEPTQNW
jgi:hypothetical protein